MPKEFSRTERVGELLQRKLSQLIKNEIKDPRITGLITITEVKVTTDFSQAKVYVTVLGKDAQEQKEVLAPLNEAAGFLRKLLSSEVKLRTTPQLIFVYDETLAYGNRLSKLIDDALSKKNDDEE